MLDLVYTHISRSIGPKGQDTHCLLAHISADLRKPTIAITPQNIITDVIIQLYRTHKSLKNPPGPFLSSWGALYRWKAEKWVSHTSKASVLISCVGGPKPTLNSSNMPKQYYNFYVYPFNEAIGGSNQVFES